VYTYTCREREYLLSKKITFLPVFVVLPGALEIVNQRAKKEDNATSKRQQSSSLSGGGGAAAFNIKCAPAIHTHCIIYVYHMRAVQQKSHFSLLILLQNAPEKNAAIFFSQN
jgi:hypothetical protein